ncbi:hypothetical protein LTR20_010812 [Exophiala xenobiotica]|nr:hypothetical protein LTS13_010845 [Exophiala xenobiotica]KAK5403050.1 hypothetical protein LTR06_010476 [Exophiala xenobiotica]KAK5453265.1 hypothetical protein LTR20_010812 [Exophiala xenobiotica]
MQTIKKEISVSLQQPHDTPQRIFNPRRGTFTGRLDLHNLSTSSRQMPRGERAFASPQRSSGLPSLSPTFIHGLGDIASPTAQRAQYGAIYDVRSPQRGSTELSPQDTFGLGYAIEANDIESHETVRVKEEDMPVFAYFIDQCGPWLDIVSPDRRIAQNVSKLALKCPVLYYACLAYAARVLHLYGRMDLDRSESYQSQAIRHLIPSLDPSKSSTAEILLPTTVILRMAEQFLELADDPQCHMQGAYSVFSAANSSYSPSRTDVQGVSFWIGVRECLRICFLYERECQFDIEIVDTNDILGQASDEVWTNRMTYHLARLCNICWGAVDKPRLGHDFETIAADIDLWRQHLPDGFKPWYYQDNVSDIFPIIKYYSTWHGEWKSIIKKECTNIVKLSDGNSTTRPGL